MSNTKQSYTWDLMNATMAGLVASKEAHGMRMLKSGLIEDCVGSLLAFDIVQSVKTTGQGEDAIEIHEIKVTLKTANVVNF